MRTTERWIPARDHCCSCAGQETIAFRAAAHDCPENRHVEIVECCNCHFAWQFPVSRSFEESTAVFSNAYEGSDGSQASYFDPDRRARVATIELDFVETLPVSGRRMLDVGGGDGTFALAAAKRGWLVTAADPAINPSRLPQKGLTVIRGTAGDLSPELSFDVVTLWDVIEHVEDPPKLLEALRSRVPLGGWLIVETGNYKCAERVRSAGKHWIYQLDHRWYFSPDSLTRLLEAEGWKVIDHARRVLRPDWSGREDYAGPSVRNFISSLVKSPTRIVDHVQRHSKLKASALWPQSGLEIFCLATQRVA